MYERAFFLIVTVIVTFSPLSEKNMAAKESLKRIDLVKRTHNKG